jgi:LPXTG-motif cell wall-anchored protein
MRRGRWIGAAMLVGATLGGPSVAWADGGAYLDLDRTHYLPGQTAHAEGYVYVPRAKQHLFERGPFYLYVTQERNPLIEGRPIPERAVRVGTVSIDREGGKEFELSASFVVPQLDGESYALAVCNEPCTISGFRESLTGTISIIATAREGELLNRVDLLKRQAWNLRRQVRRSERADEELRAQLGLAEVARSELAIRVRELEAAAARATPSGRRPLESTWVALTLAGGLFAAALALVVWRRRRRRLGPAVSDPTVAMKPAPATTPPKVPVG